MKKYLMMMLCATSLSLGAFNAQAKKADTLPPPPPASEEVAPMPPHELDVKKLEKK